MEIRVEKSGIICRRWTHTSRLDSDLAGSSTDITNPFELVGDRSLRGWPASEAVIYISSGVWLPTHNESHNYIIDMGQLELVALSNEVEMPLGSQEDDSYPAGTVSIMTTTF
jgi:hypothetical protein